MNLKKRIEKLEKKLEKRYLKKENKIKERAEWLENYLLNDDNRLIYNICKELIESNPKIKAFYNIGD